MNLLAPVEARAARVIRVTGVVQGVGFRPFVHRLATALSLSGWVRNRAGDVEIVIAGAREALDVFLERLRREAPPLARIRGLDVAPAAPVDARTFSIAPSDDRPEARQPVLPDAALCERCEGELFDPANRRYGYPFITCTDCGPRYSVIERLPYDRERTSMRTFTLCARCAAEYASPGDRRYHSETNSCAECGPSLWYERVSDAVVVTGAAYAIEAAAADLRAGRIVALRGLGGFHLAVDAMNEAAVARLRERKHREAKPLAIMVRTVDEARAVAHVAPAEAELLQGAERPIVLLRRAERGRIAQSVAPGMNTIGVMLAYTPLHHLLLAAVRRPLVMTSGNIGDDPIVAGVRSARSALAPIADALLLHDREIVHPIDDSVLRVAAGAPRFLRRARGYAPLPVELPIAAPTTVLAVGAHQKATFTLAAGRTAYVSQHVGDLDTLETVARYRELLETYGRLYRLTPQRVACDAHPGYASTRIAEELAGGDAIVVQHHYAHVAAVMAEHGVTGPVIGVAYDGTGAGDDGHVWGGELFVADLTSYRRVGRLRYAPLPGGELAIRAPWRVALGYLALAPEAAASFELAFGGISEQEREIATTQARRGLNAPLASSMGRLFDAAAAVIGLRRHVHYEGQAAMELEGLAGSHAPESLCLPSVQTGADGVTVVDPLPFLASLGDRARAGYDPRALAAGVHEVVACATAEFVRRACDEYGITTVTLGGGVFQNARLLAAVHDRLARERLRVLMPRRLPANDGAISYGQAAVAAALLAAGLDRPAIRQGG
jgi:hydrogenase maturation protein HypF